MSIEDNLVLGEPAVSVEGSDRDEISPYVEQLLQFVFKLDLPPSVLRKLNLAWVSEYVKSKSPPKPLVSPPILPTSFDLPSFIRELANALFDSFEEIRVRDVFLVLLDQDSPLALRQALVIRASTIPQFDFTLACLFELSQKDSSSAVGLLLFLAQSLADRPAFLQRMARHPNKPPALIEFFLDHLPDSTIFQALVSDSTLPPIYLRRIMREYFHYRLEAQPVHPSDLIEHHREQFRALVTLCRDFGIRGFENADPMDDEVLRRVCFSARRLQVYVQAATLLLNDGAIPGNQHVAFAQNLAWLDQFHRLWISRKTLDGQEALMHFVKLVVKGF